MIQIQLPVTGAGKHQNEPSFVYPGLVVTELSKKTGISMTGQTDDKRTTTLLNILGQKASIKG